jgi:hypothetical protein
MKLWAVWTLIPVFYGAPALAQLPALEWHGFLTEIVAAADQPVNYASGITSSPDYASESRLGLNLSSKLNSKLGVASQFVARGFERTGRISADWAFLSYYPTETLSLRLGKQRLLARV